MKQTGNPTLYMHSEAANPYLFLITETLFEKNKERPLVLKNYYTPR